MACLEQLLDEILSDGNLENIKRRFRTAMAFTPICKLIHNVLESLGTGS